MYTLQAYTNANARAIPLVICSDIPIDIKRACVQHYIDPNELSELGCILYDIVVNCPTDKQYLTHFIDIVTVDVLSKHINYEVRSTYQTPLMYAAYKQDLNTCKILIEILGADPCHKCIGGQTAYTYAGVEGKCYNYFKQIENKKQHEINALRIENKQLTGAVSALTSKIDSLADIVAQLSMGQLQGSVPFDIDREIKRKRIVTGTEPVFNDTDKEPVDTAME